MWLYPIAAFLKCGYRPFFFFFCSAFILAFKCCAQGSRILVTTHKGRVAKMIGSAHIMNLGQLSNVNCWLIFSIHLGTPFASMSGRKTHFIFFFIFFFFKPKLLTFIPWTVHSCIVHESHKLYFSTTFLLKIDPTILFTFLKIILL